MSESELDRRFGIIMGSESDSEIVQHCLNTFKVLGVVCVARVMSAHRTPDLVRNYALQAKDNDKQVIIAAAGGGAAHLAGFVAAYTRLPVVGIPIDMDSLVSIVQMPRGRPVLTMAVGVAGAVNAALAAAEIVALNDPVLDAALEKYRQNQTGAVLALSHKLFFAT